ncbi:MAG TPA: hypothetical protein DCQ64_12030 [Candidatus Rokubacteria bacterium]|nr:MAG: hypothetical protein A2X53_23100 [Candidatus Rokubacteria bacterium GWA2_70_23]HAM56083.1 hypothetical protein [Candidatus Rokubacteria bacterium]
MNEFLREIGVRYPSARDSADSILRLDTEVERLPAVPFFEPMSLVEVVDGKRRLLTLSSDLLNAWSQHAAYGARIRMRSTERAIFSELKVHRLLPAMTLARAHMEAAAQAAYCEQLLVDTAKTGAWDDIGEAVLRTMLGTSLRIAAKREPRVDEFINPTEHFPLEIGETIKALDRFAAAGEAPGRHSQVMYSFLCEFAHPALRGVKTFFESTDSDLGGWTIRYRTDGSETVSEAEFRMALEIVLENMRYGYACSELLRRSRVGGVYPYLELTPPSRTDLRYVWLQLLQRPG